MREENMISAIRWIFILFAIIVFAVGVWTMFGPMIDNNYDIPAKVVSNDTIVDSRGEYWEFEDLPYKVGTELKVTFNDNHTTTIYDDTIIDMDLLED